MSVVEEREGMNIDLEKCKKFADSLRYDPEKQIASIVVRTIEAGIVEDEAVFDFYKECSELGKTLKKDMERTPDPDPILKVYDNLKDKKELMVSTFAIVMFQAIEKYAQARGRK